MAEISPGILYIITCPTLTWSSSVNFDLSVAYVSGVTFTAIVSLRNTDGFTEPETIKPPQETTMYLETNESQNQTKELNSTQMETKVFHFANSAVETTESPGMFETLLLIIHRD